MASWESTREWETEREIPARERKRVLQEIERENIQHDRHRERGLFSVIEFQFQSKTDGNSESSGNSYRFKDYQETSAMSQWIK